DKGEGDPVIKSPIPDYVFPGIENESVATAAAGVTGTLIAFGVMYGLAKTVRKKSPKAN
ncbi:MAG: PDGLE domain-containing protein, partial [Firmicutes bacterium]|nr:PDGLE domain-containing protein [Bacillota bacterium]